MPHGKNSNVSTIPRRVRSINGLTGTFAPRVSVVGVGAWFRALSWLSARPIRGIRGYRFLCVASRLCEGNVARYGRRSWLLPPLPLRGIRFGCRLSG